MKRLLFLILFPSFLYAQISFNQELVPYEMELMIKHLEKFPSEFELPLSDELKIINQDMSLANKDETYFLFKSEIYKQILDSEILKLEASSIRVTTTLIKNAKSKLDANKLIYSDFSQWIILSITSDLNEFVSDGFLDRSENIDRSNEKDLLRLKNLQKILGYLSPWLETFTRLTPQQFNQMVSKLSRTTVHKIAQKTSFFQSFSLKLGESTAKSLFTIPFNSNTETTSSEEGLTESAPTLIEESRSRKEDAQNSLKDIEADPSEASELIDNLPVENAPSEWQPEGE